MPVSVFSAAHRLCEASGWTLSNLKLQKILFLAHMVHLGERGEGLVIQPFEAWDYGPVSPDLYQRVKAFGNQPVRNVFHGDPMVVDPNINATLDRVYGQVGNWSAGQLVRTTHRKNGAWEACYNPDYRGAVIPNERIQAEYFARLAEQRTAAGGADVAGRAEVAA
jgi:uncharacterized phage-associated protein